MTIKGDFEAAARKIEITDNDNIAFTTYIADGNIGELFEARHYIFEVNMLPNGFFFRMSK